LVGHELRQQSVIQVCIVLFVLDYCVYGDYRGLFDLDDGTRVSCKEIGRPELVHKCYEPKIATDCCETCERLRRDVEGV